MSTNHFYNDNLLASAKVDINATGHIWMEYSEKDRQRLVSMIYELLGVDKKKYSVQKGVEALDTVFYTVFKKVIGKSKNKDIGFFLKKRCIDVMREMTNKAE